VKGWLNRSQVSERWFQNSNVNERIGICTSASTVRGELLRVKEEGSAPCLRCLSGPYRPRRLKNRRPLPPTHAQHPLPAFAIRKRGRDEVAHIDTGPRMNVHPPGAFSEVASVLIGRQGVCNHLCFCFGSAPQPAARRSSAPAANHWTSGNVVDFASALCVECFGQRRCM